MASKTDWTEVAAVATGAAALATSVAAGFTALMARRTTVLATETRKMAEATKVDADASLRLAQMAQLAYQPVLIGAMTGSTDSAQPPGSHVRMINVGAGAALDCAFAAYGPSGWCMGSLPELVAGGERTITAKNRGQVAPMHLWEPETPTPRRPFSSVLFCRDIMDNRYRFLVDGEGRALPPDLSPADDHRLGPAAPLTWRNEGFIWGRT